MALGLDWPRAYRWLKVGRPLSLIALDALGLSLQKGRTFADLRLPPADEFAAALDEYAATDSAPRALRSVEHLKAYGQAQAPPGNRA